MPRAERAPAELDWLDLRSLLDLHGIGSLDFAALAGGEYLRATIDRDGSAGRAAPLTIATSARDP